MTLLMGLDLGQRGDYTAVCVIRERTITVEVPENERTLAAGLGLPSVPYAAMLATAPTWEQKQAQDAYEHAKWLAERRIRDGHPRLLTVSTTRYEGVWLHRFALGTPYPTIVREVCRRLNAPQMREGVTLILDATGVGVAVLDLFREAPDLAAPLVPITITGGESVRVEPREDGPAYWVPKRDLVAVLSVLMPEPEREDDPGSVPQDVPRLVMARSLPLTPLFLAEAHNFRVTINTRGHDSYEAGPLGNGGRDGEHDDVVLAVALPLWYAQQGRALESAQSPGVPPLLLGGAGWRTAAERHLQGAPYRRAPRDQ